MRRIAHFLFRVLGSWWSHKATTFSAAVAFYTIFSLAPVLLIATAVAGRFVSRERVQIEIVQEVDRTIGPQAAQQVGRLIDKAQEPETGILAAVVGTAALVLGATAVFNQLRDALSTIWDVHPPVRPPWWRILHTRLLSLAMVMTVAFLLLVALVLSAALSAAGKWVAEFVPAPVPVLQLADMFGSSVLFTFLFTLIYRFLPDIRLPWRDLVVGAAVTALFFNGGKIAIGLYLGRSTVASIYGAAGSLAVILVWVYYSVLIFLLGAEFTCVLVKSKQESRGE